MYEIPQSVRLLQLTPLEGDECPDPGGRFINVRSDDDADGVVIGFADAAKHTLGKAGATISGATYTITASGGACAITPAEDTLDIGSASQVDVSLGAFRLVSAAAAPQETDVDYPLGTLWVVTGAGAVGLYQLTAITEGTGEDPDTATWSELAFAVAG